MRVSMQNIFAAHFDAYALQHRLHPRESRAAWCIRNCYTSACGSHTLRCPQGHFTHEQFHACSHRSCPRCSPRTRASWIDAELGRLLPCPHFHVVFTLPHELLLLWQFNRERLIQLFFDAVRHTLLELLADPRHLGATPGLLMALHTWGRNLSHHPHIHALVTAGGLTPDLRWRPTRDGFLLPLKPLQRLFCGKLLAGLLALLHSSELRLPPRQPASYWASLLRSLYRKHWNVQINPAYSSGRSVTLYLARYAKGGPLPKHRPLFLHHGTVSFDYTDHRNKQSNRLHLAPAEFISRVLWHAPPTGVHTVRHAGLYATAARRHHLHALISLTSNAADPPPAYHAPPQARPTTSSAPRCPTCNAPLWRSYSAAARSRTQGKNQIPLYQSAHSRATTSHLGPTTPFKPKRNGKPPGPGWWYTVHSHQPGPGGLPPRSA